MQEVKEMVQEGISMKCRKVGDYSVEMESIGGWSNELTITRNSDGMPVLFVIIQKDEENPSMMSTTVGWKRKPTQLSGMEVFDIVAMETLTMRNILSRLLDEVKKTEAGFITIDLNYNGIGVELGTQFGYMTGGMKTNLSTMSVEVSSVMVFSDVDCNITLCCIMKYTRNGKGVDRLVRLGSGKGVDEAILNTKRKIESMTEGMSRIDEYLFDRLCIGCNEKEQSEAIF